MTKMTSIKLFASLTAMAVSATSLAQETYVGGNAAFLDYSEDGIRDEASLTAIYGRLGSQFNEILSAEFRLGLGIGDDSIGFMGRDVDVDLKNMFGAYVRAGLPVTDVFYPYAVIGYTRGEVEYSLSGFGSDSDAESDVSFGVGSDFSLGQQMTINVEYMNYLDKNGVEIDGFSVGFAKSF